MFAVLPISQRVDTEQFAVLLRSGSSYPLCKTGCAGIDEQAGRGPQPSLIGNLPVLFCAH